jgi:hypothetical protein
VKYFSIVAWFFLRSSVLPHYTVLILRIGYRGQSTPIMDV